MDQTILVVSKIQSLVVLICYKYIGADLNGMVFSFWFFLKVIFLLTKAGVSENDIGKVIALAPELLGCSIAKKLEHSLKYFLSLGISVDELGEMIADFPMLLRYNVDVLRPKYRYLRRTMIRPLKDLIEFPRYLTILFY